MQFCIDVINKRPDDQHNAGLVKLFKEVLSNEFHLLLPNFVCFSLLFTHNNHYIAIYILCTLYYGDPV